MVPKGKCFVPFACKTCFLALQLLFLSAFPFPLPISPLVQGCLGGRAKLQGPGRGKQVHSYGQHSGKSLRKSNFAVPNALWLVLGNPHPLIVRSKKFCRSLCCAQCPVPSSLFDPSALRPKGSRSSKGSQREKGNPRGLLFCAQDTALWLVPSNWGRLLCALPFALARRDRVAHWALGTGHSPVVVLWKRSVWSNSTNHQDKKGLSPPVALWPCGPVALWPCGPVGTARTGVKGVPQLLCTKRQQAHRGCTQCPVPFGQRAHALFYHKGKQRHPERDAAFFYGVIL